MAHVRMIKKITRFTLMTGMVTASLPALAATVTLTFEGVDPNTNHHGTTITENGYTITSSSGLNSTKPSNGNTNGTVSIYSQSNTPVTITAGPTDDYVFDVLSIDLGELFSAGTPIASFSGLKADGSTATGQLVISGASSFWNYHVTFGSLFTNLVSFTLGNNSPYLYQFDNIELSSAATLTQTPIPGALPLYLSGIGAFAFAAYRRRKKRTQNV